MVQETVRLTHVITMHNDAAERTDLNVSALSRGVLADLQS